MPVPLLHVGLSLVELAGFVRKLSQFPPQWIAAMQDTNLVFVVSV